MESDESCVNLVQMYCTTSQRQYPIARVRENLHLHFTEMHKVKIKLASTEPVSLEPYNILLTLQLVSLQ